MRKISFLFVFICVAAATFAQSDKIFTTKEGAVGGYDVVAYFKDGKPVKGDNKISFEWSGAKWYFSSPSNRDEFKKSPEKFAPQFGGYCAYGVAHDHKSPTQPDAWTIVDGKLYLNYNLDVRKLWNEKQSEFIKTANEKWPTVKSGN